MRTIPLLVESERGHDTIDVPQTQLQNAVESQLKDDKWVTLEKEDGNTKILTESDMPKEQPKEETPKGQAEDKQNKLDDDLGDLLDKPAETQEDWADNFKKVRSATATNKSKGG